MPRHDTVMGVGPRSPESALREVINDLRGRLPRVMQALEDNKVGGEYPDHSESVFRKRPITFVDGGVRMEVPGYVQMLSTNKDKQGIMRDRHGNQARDPRMAVPVWYAGIAIVRGRAIVVESETGADGLYRPAELEKYPRWWNVGSLLGITDTLMKPPAPELGR
jgi:hypothetical protein